MTEPLVIDANAVVELLMQSAEGRAVAAIVADRPLSAPACIDPEVLHALRGLERGGKAATARVDLAVDRFTSSSIARIPHEQLIDEAWRLRHNLSAYDAMYVALARGLRCPLITMDAGIAAAPDLGVTVIRPAA